MVDNRQTNCTILLGEFTPDIEDILTIMGDTRGISAVSDDLIKELLDKLLVHSYEEFEKKLPIKAYGFFNAEDQKMIFTLKKPEHLPPEYVTEYPLGIRSPSTGVLFDMIDARSRQGARNVEFNFESMVKQLSPEKMQSAIRQVRKELLFKLERHNELLEDDPIKDDVATELNNLMSEAREYYNNPIQMLALAADDCDQRLLLGASAEENRRTEKISVGLLNFAEDGTLKVIAAPKPEQTALALTEGETSTALATILEQDYEETAGDQASEYVKSLVVRAFSPLAATAGGEVDIQKEVENRNAFLSMYTESQQAFLACVKPALELMLGVYLFFQQYEYTIKSKSGMRPGLLIANCDPELLARSTYLPRLQTLLNSCNMTNDYEHCIWQAIFPNLSYSKAGDKKEVKEVFAVKKEKKKTDVYSMETLSTLVSVFADYGVQVFFSFETGNDTCFDKVAKEGIAPFIERTAKLTGKDYSAFAIPCLPNITVVPKNKSGVVTGKLMVTDGENVGLSEEKEDIQRFFLNGVYIPAAFIAAGITAAWQCPEFLREKFHKNVDPQLPGVRFDIEAANNALAVPTTLAREISGFTEVVKSDINKAGFGFILASEKQELKGQPVNFLTVYKARSLAFDGYTYEPLFQGRLAVYYQRILRQVTGDYKYDNVKFFFSANPDSQMSKWLKLKDSVNAIVQPSDEVTYELDENGDNCDIHFTFGGVQKNVRVRLQKATARAGA